MTIAQLIQQERLPADFADTVNRYYRPLASRLVESHQGRPLLVGINGGQGTGKSTMALFLKQLLEVEHGLGVAVLSIDDLYRTRAERQQLAAEIHPLLATRGVPGTHDPEMGLQVIERLMQAAGETRTPLPRFDKAVDDRLPPAAWPVFEGRADVVILEGWCVGARPQADQALLDPVNALECEEDAEGRWRRHVNAQLRGPYRPLFERIDQLILLRAPSMECILTWRGEQQAKLRDKLEAQGADTSQLMDAAALERFIAHYQRLTEHQWADLAKVADAVLPLAADHRITGIEWKGAA